MFDQAENRIDQKVLCLIYLTVLSSKGILLDLIDTMGDTDNVQG
jgi:hypothetical protein